MMVDHNPSLSVVRVADIVTEENPRRWLIDQLWGASAVGVIGGAPKCSKTWLALDMSLSVATGTACLGRYQVPLPGPVLVYLAEDSLAIVRERVEGIARHRGLALDSVLGQKRTSWRRPGISPASGANQPNTDGLATHPLTRKGPSAGDRSRSPYIKRERNGLLLFNEKGSAMPGIDFSRLRHEITMEQVLDLLGFECIHRRADQWYGYCPLHESEPKHRRAFSVNVAMGCYYCHKCGSRGDQLKLWAEATKSPLHPATIDLCRQLGQEIPWVHRW